ncbi:unnamed protein product [Amaranthus hypochondriacus]
MATGLPCPIEMEPKTLKEVQLNHAREQAVAIQKMEPQNAPDIFFQGLKEVGSLDGKKKNANKEDHMGRLDDIVDGCIKNDNIKIDSSHHCLCTKILIEPPIPDEFREREPLTAPF